MHARARCERQCGHSGDKKRRDLAMSDRVFPYLLLLLLVPLLLLRFVLFADTISILTVVHDDRTRVAVAVLLLVLPRVHCFVACVPAAQSRSLAQAEAGLTCDNAPATTTIGERRIQCDIRSDIDSEFQIK